jgi:hypothetical protein
MGKTLTRRQRLMATLRGEAVDRPPVSFYEINGLDEDMGIDDAFNIYTDRSWRPLIDLAREGTDRIVMRSVPFLDAPEDPLEERTTTQEWIGESGARMTRRIVDAGSRRLSSLTRRDPDVNTTWTIEPLLKDVADLRALLTVPAPAFGGHPDERGVQEAEGRLGESGIVMIDTADPLCMAASLFAMEDYTVIALTAPGLFHQLLERFAILLEARTEAIARALPGRLWRIYGPEYASPPYLPPRLFQEYVVRYDSPMVGAIQRHGGFARIHSHGRLRDILDLIVDTGCVGLDPIEPPPQGDVTLATVRQRYGERLVLFGNLEASEIDMLPTDQFRQRVHQALYEGTLGEGRGFVLMPSACPYGRVLSKRAMQNYEAMVEAVEAF